MGHFYTEVQAIGPTREEAQTKATEEFFHEHGHRHSLRGVEAARLLRRVPPTRCVTREVDKPGFGVNVQLPNGHWLWSGEEEDPTAPTEKWWGEWQFVLHTHA
mgnify:FL=1